MEVCANKGTPIAWVVSALDKATFDEVFQALDTDVDGFVSGSDPEVKSMFIRTGLPQNVLAHIWNLCDVKQNGQLNSEQFALAMYFINQSKFGIELPASLLPEMVPPTLRPKPTGNSGSDSILNGN
ncbi:hypothetical protein B4U80_12908 [Leptotrombidium deliense]|uniref:Epidermal growth factor receptor substrate 15-like 1 n=1 Tax=Leptotrombidium deliense TaxID=299467 RepID=A0A443SVF5_9ACAR|nr:hypothetical protein B4U80_12908 [Leptotrombidium deliense]